MHTAVCTLKSAMGSAFSPSRAYQVEKGSKESHADFEKRTWRERAHFDAQGQLYIPGVMFKQALDAAAQFLGEKIQGKGNSTWTKHFLAGIMVLENLPLPVKKDDVDGEWLFVPSDGKKGSGKRVHKCFPVVREWSGKLTFTIVDGTITEEVFKHHLEQAGTFIGIGRWRPRVGGMNGRFKVEKMEWK